MPDHHPPHVFLDDTWYLISSSTVDHARFLAGDQQKILVRDTLRDLVVGSNLTLRAWVILGNHYHLLIKANRGQDLPRFFARLHGSTSRQINLADSVQGRQVWHNYWDSGIRSEAGLWTRFNYIHQNPVKHGYVREPSDWPFSSYGYYLRTKEPEWIEDCWLRYPPIDFVEGDDFGSTVNHTG